MQYLAFVTVKLACKSFEFKNENKPMRINATNPAIAASRAIKATAKEDSVKRKKVDYYTVKVMPIRV